jgi:hypothetical protein
MLSLNGISTLQIFSGMLQVIEKMVAMPDDF